MLPLLSPDLAGPAGDTAAAGATRGARLRRAALVTTMLAALSGCASREEALAPVEDYGDQPRSYIAGGSIQVARGDSVYSIAQKYNIPMQALIDANNLQPPYLVEQGQVLVLPGHEAAGGLAAGAAGGMGGGMIRHVVASGESLGILSRRFDVPVRDLLALNPLPEPDHLEVGQVLLIPSRDGDAVMQPAVMTGSTAGSWEDNPDAVLPGDPFAPVPSVGGGAVTRIPLAGDPVAPAAAAPGLASRLASPSAPALESARSGPPTPAVRSHQWAALPGAAPRKPGGSQRSSTAQIAGAASATQVASAPVAAPLAAPVQTAPASGNLTQQMQEAQAAQAAAAPADLGQPVSLTTPPPTAAPAAAATTLAPAAPVQAPAPAPAAAAVQAPKAAPAAQAPKATAIFAWPVQGRVLSTFGAKDNGLTNDGINIAAAAGTPVKAAGGGTVAYAGNELRNFGNLVLIRHEDGFMTAYAHLDAIKVKRGEQLKRGQVIGTVGSTGSVNEPQLHFEVRQGTKAVEPTQYMGGPA